MADRDEYESVSKRLTEKELLEWIKINEPWRLDKEKIERDIPDESWTEPEIEDWIEKKKLPIKYDIRNKTKKWALNKIKKYI